MATPERMNQLYAGFDLKTREGLGGMKFKYIPSADVIHRMNNVFMGCWSTEIITKDIVEEAVVVHVRVTALDPDSNKYFAHDGFGSNHIARFTSGMKKGQIIDIGNSYKGAESMAIRHACTRFGVGLYLEGEGFEGVDMNTPPAMPQMPNAFKESGDMPQTIPPTPVAFPGSFVPPVATPVMVEAPAASPSVPEMPAVTNTPAVPVEVPPSPEPPVVSTSVPLFPGVQAPTSTTVSASFMVPPSVSTEATMSMPKIPSPTGETMSLGEHRAPKPSMVPPPADFIPNSATSVSNTQTMGITDVQKVAINGILSLKGVDFNKVLTDAFVEEGWDTAVLPELDALTYKQAVAFIRHGSKYRNN